MCNASLLGLQSSYALGCPGCGGACQSMNGLHGPEQYIGKFVRSQYAIYMYKAPGEAAFATRKPNSYIGKIAALNSKQNWAKLTDGNWIYFADPSIYTFKDPVQLTPTQIKEVEDVVRQTYLNTTIPSGQVLNVAYDVAQGAGEALDFGANLISFLGKNLKWIGLGAAALVAYKLYNDFKPKAA